MSKFFKALEQAERDRARRETQGPETPLAEAVKTSAPPAAKAADPARTEPGTPPEAVVGEAPVPVHPAPAGVAAVPLRPRDETPPAPRPSPASRDGNLSVDPSPGTTVSRPIVAQLDVDGGARVEEHLVSLLFPATFEAEQYRALRHVVEQHRAASGLTVVAVTSPSVGDGKTTTTINLAGALAQAPGARVLLIDADLRRPILAEHLGLATPTRAERPGLVDALVDARLRLDDIVEQCPEFNLTVVPAGPTPQAPYELLQSGRLAELLEEARRSYHYVILDTPPLVAVPDGRLISKAVDGFILVVRAHRTPRKLLEEALSLSDPQKLLGLVFNRDDRPLSGYYRGYQVSHPLSTRGNGGRWSRLLRSGRRNGTGR